MVSSLQGGQKRRPNGQVHLSQSGFLDTVIIGYIDTIWASAITNYTFLQNSLAKNDLMAMFHFIRYVL